MAGGIYKYKYSSSILFGRNGRIVRVGACSGGDGGRDGGGSSACSDGSGETSYNGGNVFPSGHNSLIT